MPEERTCRTCGAEGCFGMAARGASYTGWCPPNAAERLDAERKAPWPLTILSILYIFIEGRSEVGMKGRHDEEAAGRAG